MLNYFLSFNITLITLFTNAEFHLTLTVLTVITNSILNLKTLKAIIF